MFDLVIATLDWFGVAVFAVTGALVASRKEMDIFGFALLATVTGIGGGSVRDLLLGVPVFWVREPAYVAICVAVSAVVFFTAHIPESRYRLLMWLDAVGLAFFCVVGAGKGLDAGAGPFIAVVMAVITASFGGIIRDVIGGESPFLLRKGHRGLSHLLRHSRPWPALWARAADLSLTPRPLGRGIETPRALARRQLALASVRSRQGGHDVHERQLLLE